MNNDDLLVYESEQFGKLGIAIIDGKEYFPATECAKILSYANPHKAIIDHCKYLTKREVPHPQSKDRFIKVNYIPEGDLYRLIIRSRLPEAQKFESWIFDEVIPSIRKRGMYLTPETFKNALKNPQYLIDMLTELDNEQKKSQELEMENALLSVKVGYLDKILQSSEAVQVTKIAKDYGFSGIAFNKMLHSFGIQFPLGRTWVLYQKYANQGYTHSRTYSVSEEKSVTQTFWTQKGRKFLYEFLKEQGIKPLIEQE